MEKHFVFCKNNCGEYILHNLGHRDRRSNGCETLSVKPQTVDRDPTLPVLTINSDTFLSKCELHKNQEQF